jgi:hypothetical protein
MHLIDGFGAVMYQRFAHTVQNRQGLLGLGFRRNEAHGWTRGGLANRFGIDEVVFVALNEGANELWRNQLGRMPIAVSWRATKCAPAQASITTTQLGRLPKNASSAVARVFAKHLTARLILAVKVETVFAEIDTDQR